MIGRLHLRALASVAALAAIGCDYSVWLSEDLDAGTRLDATLDAPRPPDVGPPDAPEIDAGTPRACEIAPAILGTVRSTVPLEQPTFATSGRLESLRYGVLVPPSSSTVATEDTTLIVADREGAVVTERALPIVALGAAASTATVHGLDPASATEGFLVLGPESIWLLDAAGAGDPIAIPTPPSPDWQRAAGWIDADRFLFVDEAFMVEVFDRASGTASATTISAMDAACVHVDPGGVTISRPGAGVTSDTVVYAPELDGTEVLRTSWDDGTTLGARLLASATLAGERTWIVRDANEFRTAVASYRVPATGDPIRGTALMLLSPITASLEGNVIAIQGSLPTLTLYSVEHASFMALPPPTGTTLVEPEHDGEQVAVLTLRPDATGGLSLELTCTAH